MEDKINEYLYESVFGFALGDALGVPVEGKDREYLEQNPITHTIDGGVYGYPAGTWSDDTALTLATLDGIKCNRTDLFWIVRNFQAWLEQGWFTIDKYAFGRGRTVTKAIRLYDERKCYIVTEYLDSEQGNGSLMRIMPIAFMLLDQPDLEERRRTVFKYSALTHGHPTCKVACHFYVEMFIRLLKDKTLIQAYEETRKELGPIYRGSDAYKRLRRVFNGSVRKLSRDEIESTGYVVHTLEAVLWCLFNTDNYKDAILTAVNLGGDTDTIGAITGGAAAVIHYDKREKLPDNWTLRGCDILLDAIDAYLGMSPNYSFYDIDQ